MCDEKITQQKTRIRDGNFLMSALFWSKSFSTNQNKDWYVSDLLIDTGGLQPLMAF